jgi:hypothetical protein
VARSPDRATRPDRRSPGARGTRDGWVETVARPCGCRMVEVNENELVFSFPDVNDGAVLRVHFRGAVSPEARVRILLPPVDGGLLLAAYCRVVMHLRPNDVGEDFRYPSGVRYPFAVLLSVGGINALTGEPSSALVRSPQNYFATPPQGGIDGYLVGGQVNPFRGGGESSFHRTRLEIKVFPMKTEAFAYLEHRLRLIPGPGPSVRGLTLSHGGERQCEPVYEDLCCIGDWDQRRGEMALIWLDGHRYRAVLFAHSRCGNVSPPCHPPRPKVSTKPRAFDGFVETFGQPRATVKRPCHNAGEGRSRL